MLQYKIDILEEMKKHGFNTSRIRKEKILSESTLQRIRQGGNLNTDTINTICIICRCQPGDIIEVKPTDQEKIKYF